MKNKILCLFVFLFDLFLASCSQLVNFEMPVEDVATDADSGGDDASPDLNEEIPSELEEMDYEVEVEDVSVEESMELDTYEVEVEIQPGCGNGILEEGEECDDGNHIENDGCRSNCTFTCTISTQETDCNDNHDCTIDTCDPITHTCNNAVAPNSLICREAVSGVCDVPEYCDGVNRDCPGDSYADEYTLCRSTESQCDVPEFCTGNSPVCPDDFYADDGTECNDENPCTINDVCTSGTCRGLESNAVCNFHGTCDPAQTPVCLCNEGYTGDFCENCDDGYVRNPDDSHECIPDPCIGVTCSGEDTCNGTYTAIVRLTGNCIPAGPNSYICETSEISCAPGICYNNACILAVQPGAGEIIINEIMIDPVKVADENGQWFEIYNSSSSLLNLSGIIVNVTNSGGTNAQLIVPFPPVLLQSGSYFVFGRNSDTGSNGNVPVDMVFSDMFFIPSDGRIELISQDGSTIIDYVQWDSSWPVPSGFSVTGYSMSLSPQALANNPSQLNNEASHWCYAQAEWSENTDYGSPGVVNQQCVIDWCNLQWPHTTTVVRMHQTENIYGQVYEPPLTTFHDQTPFIIAQVGFGAQGVVPDNTWTWFDAIYNPGFPSGQNNEEFMGKITAPSAPGSYDYAYRMSLDGGLSWFLCDIDGSSNGYDSTQAGNMTVEAGNIFFSEYIEGSSYNKAIEIYNPLNSSVSLDNCLIRIYFNGSTTPSPNTVSLSGYSIEALDVFVVCNNQADSAIISVCDLQSNNISFNGADVVELYCNFQTVDIIGRIGEDPGTEWGTGNTSTMDNTLVRKCNISQGDVDGSDPFDPAVEWDGYIGDTFTYLGSHTTCY